MLKLATFPRENNLAALIVELVLLKRAQMWASPAMLEEYADVLSDAPEFLEELAQVAKICYPLTPLQIIRHEPDNRFVECALAVDADFLLTVNTKPGHFDQTAYGSTQVMTPGMFVRHPKVQALLANR